MKKVDISSMFLVPKNIYTSMLSRIDENDVKEDINLLNRQRDDGNYIEKAINFNDDQERHRKQIFIKPNLSNVTATTNANTDYASIRTNNLSQPATNINNSYISNMDQSMSGIASTPNQGQAALTSSMPLTPIEEDQSEIAVTSTPTQKRTPSTLPLIPIPIKDTLTKFDAEGKLTCYFCRDKFSQPDALKQHLVNMHWSDINMDEQNSLLNISLGLSPNQNPQYNTSASTNTSTFENTGTKRKLKKVQIVDTSPVKTRSKDKTSVSTQKKR